MTVTAILPEPAPPSLSVTVRRTVSVPAAVYVCVAVIGFAWLLVLPVVCEEPSPQVIVYAQGASFMPASLNVALKVNALPAVAVWLAPAFTVGATFVMVAVLVAGALAAPCESVTEGLT